MHFKRTLALVLPKTSLGVHTYGSGIQARAQSVLGVVQARLRFYPRAQKNVSPMRPCSSSRKFGLEPNPANVLSKPSSLLRIRSFTKPLPEYTRATLIMYSSQGGGGGGVWGTTWLQPFSMVIIGLGYRVQSCVRLDG